MKRVLLYFSFFIFHFSFIYAQHFVFYGMTAGAGTYGTIYRYDPLTSKYQVMIKLDTVNCNGTWAGLTLANNGLLYGTTEAGGKYNYGTMFSYNRMDNELKVLINFDSIHNGQFDASSNNIMQASNGLLYGVTEAGGHGDKGVFYSYDITTEKDSVILSFDSLNMSTPNGPIIEDTNTGYLYGTTEHGGTNDYGTIFRYDPKTNKDTVVFYFDTTNNGGVMPVACTFFRNSYGIFYGMTPYGGGYGTIYKFNPNTFKDTTLMRFTGPNGIGPWICNLMKASNGLLYGVTLTGGSNSDGVLFSFDTSTDKETVLVNFNSTNGSEPTGDLVQDPDNGKLYGTTAIGGAYNMGVLYCYDIKTGKDSVCVNFNGINGAYPAREPTLVWDTTKADTTNAIKQLKVENRQWTIYPNPNNGKFTIECGTEKERAVVEIYNMLGELVKSEELRGKGTVIDISNQSAGIYLYRVVTETGNLVGEGKLIIQ